MELSNKNLSVIYLCFALVSLGLEVFLVKDFSSAIFGCLILSAIHKGREDQ